MSQKRSKHGVKKKISASFIKIIKNQNDNPGRSGASGVKAKKHHLVPNATFPRAIFIGVCTGPNVTKMFYDVLIDT